MEAHEYAPRCVENSSVSAFVKPTTALGGLESCCRIGGFNHFPCCKCFLVHNKTFCYFTNTSSTTSRQYGRGHHLVVLFIILDVDLIYLLRKGNSRRQANSSSFDPPDAAIVLVQEVSNRGGFEVPCDKSLRQSRFLRYHDLWGSRVLKHLRTDWCQRKTRTRTQMGITFIQNTKYRRLEDPSNM